MQRRASRRQAAISARQPLSGLMLVAGHTLLAGALTALVVSKTWPTWPMYTLLAPPLLAALYFPRLVSHAMNGVTAVLAVSAVVLASNHPERTLPGVAALLGVMVVLAEITHRVSRWHATVEAQLRALTASLQEREQRFRELAERIREVFWIAERGERIRYVSPAYEEIWGRPVRSLEEDPASFLAAVLPEDRPILRAAWERQQRGEETDVTYRVLRPDGSLCWIWDRGYPLVDEQGAVIRVVGIAEDVTEARRREEVLRFVMANARCLLWHALVRRNPGTEGPDGFHWETGVFDEVAAHRFLPLDQQRAESYAAAWWRCVVPEDRERVDGTAAAALASGRSHYSQDFRCRTRDGELRWLHEEAVIEPVEAGIWRVAGVCTDITERRLLEERLRQAEKLDSIGRLAGGVAHDFNNMLSVINGYAELILVREKLPQTAVEPLRGVLDAGQRAAALTQQLLAFSRQQVIQPRRLDLNAVVLGASRMLQRLIGEDVQLELDLDPTACWVYADSSQLDQVLVNLAANARHAMPVGGCFTLATRKGVAAPGAAGSGPQRPSGECVMLSARDIGCGMDPETLANIFEPFFTTRELGKGTGLGLATVYGIVRQNGGHVEAESAVGQGTTFRIYMPAVEAADTAGTATADAAVLGGTETVLLVEDEELVRETVRLMLQQYGYRVLEAGSAAEALRLCCEHPGPLGLLLTDVVMPETSGSELAARVAAVRPETRVLYMSGHTVDATLHYGVSTQHTAFIQKPFSPDALARKVRAVLDR